MLTKRFLTISGAAGLLIAALPAAQAASHGLDSAAVANAIAEAEESRKKADSAGGEWRDVGEFIVSAKAALEKGDLAAAKQLAEKARFQSEMGYQQALDQKNADFPSYMKQ